jgi:ABC-type sugar transport system permease subunit
MENTPKLQTISNKKLFITFITLTVLNSISLIILAGKAGAYNLDGSYSEANSSELIINTLVGVIISVPLVCSILSALIAAFINKQQSYGKRFVRTFLFTIVIVYGIAFLRFVYNILSY